jgi:hypothetical protein
MLKPAVIPDLKWCPRRRHMVSRERFDKNPVRADGLNTWCKDCKREHYQSLDRAPTNPLEHLKQQLRLRVIVRRRTKVCRGCKQVRPQTREFYRCRVRKGHSDYWLPFCRQCTRLGRDRKPKVAP